MSTLPKFSFLDDAPKGRVLCIAHRGASAYARENSLAALQKAAELGTDMVEVDIRVTADEYPVVAHDDTLKRLYNLPHAISDLTLRELRMQVPDTEEPVMTFEEVALRCEALGMGMYLDIKALSKQSGKLMFEALDTFHLSDKCIAGSFRGDWLADLKAQRPQMPTSILFGSTRVNAVQLATSIGADYVHPCWENAAPEPHKLLTPEWLKAVREAGLGIVTWHEERPTEIEALVNLGVNGICSDTPDRVTAVIRKKADDSM
ncbi:MAG: glycerophosphodiester phosphodiesterase family protein [Anaerolineae bacterium]